MLLDPPSRFGFPVFFEGRLKWQTPLLWLSYFASSMAIFFLASWGPLILEDMGSSADHAAYLTSFNALCAMTGGLVLMRFTDRYGPISISALPLVAVPLLLFGGLATMTLSEFLLILIPISIFLGGGHTGRGVRCPFCLVNARASYADIIEDVPADAWSLLGKRLVPKRHDGVLAGESRPTDNFPNGIFGEEPFHQLGSPFVQGVAIAHYEIGACTLYINQLIH